MTPEQAENFVIFFVFSPFLLLAICGAVCAVSDLIWEIRDKSI